MKHFIKLGVLGLALSMNLTGCTYNRAEEIINIPDNQHKIDFVLGESKISEVHNFTQDKEVFFHAPEGYKLLLGNEKKEYYKQTIKPQENIHLTFKMLKSGDDIKEAKVIEKSVVTFKNPAYPKNQEDIRVTIGKLRNKVGDKNTFTAAPNQKDIVIEMHEYNKDEIHEFHYNGVKTDINFKLLAPKYHSFIFNGKPVKEYNFTAKKDSETEFRMTLKPDSGSSKDSYGRKYVFNLKN